MPTHTSQTLVLFGKQSIKLVKTRVTPCGQNEICSVDVSVRRGGGEMDNGRES